MKRALLVTVAAFTLVGCVNEYARVWTERDGDNCTLRSDINDDKDTYLIPCEIPPGTLLISDDN